MNTLSDKAGFLIIANMIKYTVGFIVPMVLVRMLSQSDYGTYQQLVLISATAINLMVFGLPTSVFYFYHHISKESRGALIFQTSIMLFVLGLIASVVIFVSSEFISEKLNNSGMSALLSVYALSIVFTIASEHSAPFLIAQDRYRTAVVFETGEIIVRVALLLAPLILGFGFLGLIVGVVAFSVFRFIVRIGFLFARSNVTFTDWSKLTVIKDQLAYSTPLALTSLTGVVGSTFNKGIVAAFFTPVHYAVYSVGNVPIPLASVFQASVLNVLRASLPPLVRDGELKEIVRILREATRKLSIIILPSFVFLFCFSYDLITTLFTTQYEESVVIFRIIVWEVLLDMLVLSPIPQAFGKTRINLYINLVNTLFLIVFSYALLKMIGFYGPILAYISAQYVASSLWLYAVLNLTKSSLVDILPVAHLLRVFSASILSATVAYFVSQFSPSGIVKLLTAAGTFGAGFLVFASLCSVFTDDDKRLIKRWLAKVLPNAKN